MKKINPGTNELRSLEKADKRMHGASFRFIVKWVAGPVVAAGLAGCGGSGSSTMSTTPPALTASDLSGQYVFTLNGNDPNDGDYTAAGTFTADGKGEISGGVADYNLGSGIDANVPLTGTYTVSNGVASIMLTDGGAVQNSFFVPVVKTGTAALTGYGGAGTGTLYAPASGFTPAGTYTVALTGEDEGTVTETANFVAASSGNFAGGTESFTGRGGADDLRGGDGISESGAGEWARVRGDQRQQLQLLRDFAQPDSAGWAGRSRAAGRHGYKAVDAPLALNGCGWMHDEV